MTFGTGNEPAVGGGVGAIEYECISECKCGTRVIARGIGLFGGLSGGPLFFGFSESTISLDDPNQCPDASALTGLSAVASAGVATPLGGRGCANVKLGSALGKGCGGQSGVDLGFDVYFGTTVGTNETPVCCGP